MLFPKLIYRNFTSPTVKLSPDLVYKFHHIRPFRKFMPRDRSSEDSNSTLKGDGEQYALLYKNPNPEKGDVYAYVFGDSTMKKASDAKLTSYAAQLVPWNVILSNRAEMRKFVSVEDVAVHNSYVPIDVIKSFSKLIQTSSCLVDEGVPAQLIMKVVGGILTEAESTSQYQVNEERQLTHFLRCNLLSKLPPPLMVTDTATFIDRPNKRLCQYDTSKPDLCVFSDKSTGLLITVVVTSLMG